MNQKQNRHRHLAKPFSQVIDCSFLTKTHFSHIWRLLDKLSDRRIHVTVMIWKQMVENVTKAKCQKLNFLEWT